MPKTNRTSSATSASLKTAMQLKGNYPALDALDALYSGADLCVLIGQLNDGNMRALCNNNDFFDTISPADPAISRAWTKNSLVVWLASNYVATDYLESIQGANWTISFKVNDVPFTGTSNNEASAIASAILALLAL